MEIPVLAFRKRTECEIHDFREYAFVRLPDDTPRTALSGVVWYRYTSRSGFISLDAYPVLRETAKGVWLWDRDEVRQRFVLREGKKQWACPTVNDALASFLARKRRQLSLLRSQYFLVSDVVQFLHDHPERIPTHVDPAR